MSEFSKLSGDLNAAIAAVNAANDSIQVSAKNFELQRNALWGVREYHLGVEYLEFSGTSLRLQNNAAPTIYESSIPFVELSALPNAASSDVGIYATEWVKIASSNGRHDGLAILNIGSAMRCINNAESGVRLDVTYGGYTQVGGVKHTTESIDNLFKSSGMRLNLGFNQIDFVNAYRFAAKHPAPNEPIANAFFVRLITETVGGTRKRLSDVLLTGSKIYFKSLFMIEGFK